MKVLGFILLAPMALVANLIPCGGFETWDATLNLPTSEKGRWGFQKGKEKGFAAFERTTASESGGGQGSVLSV